MKPTSIYLNAERRKKMDTLVIACSLLTGVGAIAVAVYVTIRY